MYMYIGMTRPSSENGVFSCDVSSYHKRGYSDQKLECEKVPPEDIRASREADL